MNPLDIPSEDVKMDTFARTLGLCLVHCFVVCLFVIVLVLFVSQESNKAWIAFFWKEWLDFLVLALAVHILKLERYRED